MPWDIKVGTVPLKLATAKSGAPTSGLLTLQDITPSDPQFKQAQPGFNDSSPYQLFTYVNQSGSPGKLSEEQAPGDTARPFITSTNNGRPMQMTAPLDGGTIPFTPTPLGGAPFSVGSVLAQVVLASETGAIVATTGGTDNGMWYYHYTVNQFQPVRRLGQTATDVGVPFATLGSPIQSGLRSTVAPYPTIVESQGAAWVPWANNAGTRGVINLYAAYPQALVDSGAWYLQVAVLGDIVVGFTATDPTGTAAGVTLTARKPSDFSPIAVDPSLVDSGVTTITLKIPDLTCAFPPVTLNGALYFSDDRSVWKVVYDEVNERFLATMVKQFPRITGPLCAWNGDIYVPVGNRLMKWTPGQQVWLALPYDEFGVMPAPYNGYAVATLPTADALYVVVTDNNGATTVMLRLDPRGGWTVVARYPASTAIHIGPLIWWLPSASATFQPAVNVLINGASTMALSGVLQLFEAQRDPAYLSAAARKQRAGSWFHIDPWYSGQNFGNNKLALHVAAYVRDVTDANPIKMYYQLNDDDALADSLDSANGGYSGTITGTDMAGQGTWHCAMVLNATNAAAYGLTNSGGVARGYTSQIVAGYPAARRIRWAVEIVGDTTGAVVPRLLGFSVLYTETPIKYYLWTARVRVLARDPDLQGESGVPQNAAAVDAIWQTLLGYSKSGTPVDFIDLDGYTRKVKLTKVLRDVIQFDQAGSETGVRANVPRSTGLVLKLALQEIEGAS